MPASISGAVILSGSADGDVSHGVDIMPYPWQLLLKRKVGSRC
jgi:hypothetical protein